MLAVSPFKKKLKANKNDEIIVISDSDESVIQEVKLFTSKSSDDSMDLSADSFSDTDEESVVLAKQCPLNNLDVDQLNAFLKGAPSYYNNDEAMPILEKLPMERKRLYSVDDIIKLLLHPNIKSSEFVATKVPTMICNSLSFLVNLDHLDAPEDILSDDMGVWKHNGTDKTYRNVAFTDTGVSKITPCSSKDAKSASTYMIKRVYRTHGTNRHLKKITAFVYDASDAMNSLALVIYKFDRVQDHAVLVRPHGNTKKGNQSYRRTKQSTKDMLKVQLEHCSPKVATNKVFEEKGGILLAESAGDLPRDRTQAYNFKRKQQQMKITSSCSITHGDTRDMLYVVMEQCKCAEKNDKFVQDVTCAPEPMAVLTTDQQLNDLVQFCCEPFEFGVLGIDPTFNLGEFSVTPVVYRHLLVQNAAGRSPIMLGPMLVHHRKEFRSYNYFLSTLVGLNQEAATVKAIGTDGEKTLVDAALRNFPQAAHVRCFRHLKQNIEMHLRDNHFPDKSIAEYNNDIFGWTETCGLYHEGLVDSTDIATFDASLFSLKDKWDRMEIDAFSQHKVHKPAFYQWFLKYKAEEFRHCTLRSLREEIGLGSPPKEFYTNDNEAINAKLKECLGYKKHQWGLFNAKMKELAKQQQQEVEKAIIGFGQYRIRSQYSFLSIAEDKWFRMSQEQRQRHIKKFNNTSVYQTSDSGESNVATVVHNPLDKSTDCVNLDQANVQDITIGRFGATTLDLSVKLSNAVDKIKLPYTTVEGVWKKAAALVAEDNAIVPAPGFGTNDKMVKSKSGDAPHLVRAYEHKYKCDDRCPHFKSISLCSHVVAAAESNGDLIQFVNWFCSKHGSSPNLMQIATHDMPAGAGRKNGKGPKKKAKPKQLPSDDNRVPLLPNVTIQPSTVIQSNQPPTAITSIANCSATVTPHQSVYHTPAAQLYDPSHSSVPFASLYSPHQVYSPVPYPSDSSTNPPHQTQSPVPYPPDSSTNPPHQIYSPVLYPPTYSPHQFCSPVSYPPTYPPHQFHSPVPYPPPPHQFHSPVPYPSDPSNSPQQSPPTKDSYKVCFKVGNISVCNGCRKRFTEYDKVVIQHAEDRHYTNPQTGLPASKFGNAYYHPLKECIESKRGVAFNQASLVIPDTVRNKLTTSQKNHLYQEFSVQF